jgi:hypothetical protein
LNKLVHKCENTISETASVLQCYEELLEEQDFRSVRFQYVSNTLQEFNEMHPANLDVMFQYKIQSHEESDKEKVNIVNQLLQGFKERSRRV